MTPGTPNDSFLRQAIRLDATGTGLLGLAAAGFAQPLSRLTGLTPTHVYIAAAAFVLYGVVGNLLAGKARIRGIGVGLSAFNVVGTVAAVLLVASTVLPLTSSGKAVVLGCGIYTLFFGALQWVAVLTPVESRPRSFGQLPTLVVGADFDEPLPDSDIAAWEGASRAGG